MPLPIFTRLLRILRSYYRYYFIPNPLNNIRYRIFAVIENTL